MSVPEEYGGQGMGNLVMIVITEELSVASLASAGSLITRPEILTKALLKGGTEAQKRKWLPPVAAGELMVGISVTEPDTGSDVASVRCRVERTADGWLISGAKAWCTFAGRADVLALLARTNPDPNAGARGLSLFIVPKDPFPGHQFEMRQPGGGVLHGKADATPGYRGMHSFTLGFENYLVPAENLIGEAAGEGKGFYLQMGGFAAGRLQTGGRASALPQAALEATATYASERRQFGRPIGDFQLTQHKLGRMATHLAAARQLTYAAARAMDRDETVVLEPAMAKLFASDVAVRVTQEGQLLHGGWGYAEEFAISRHVVAPRGGQQREEGQGEEARNGDRQLLGVGRRDPEEGDDRARQDDVVDRRLAHAVEERRRAAERDRGEDLACRMVRGGAQRLEDYRRQHAEDQDRDESARGQAVGRAAEELRDREEEEETERGVEPRLRLAVAPQVDGGELERRALDGIAEPPADEAARCALRAG